MNVTLPTRLGCSDCDLQVAAFLLLPASPHPHFHCELRGAHQFTDCVCDEPCQSPFCTCETAS